MNIKKYFKFISNLTRRKKKTKTVILSDKIEYKVVYSNNYIDSLHNILSQYDSQIDEELKNINVCNCVDNADYVGIDKVISSISNYNEYTNVLSKLSNIIVEITIDKNNNWSRLCRFLCGAGIPLLLSTNEEVIYASLTLNNISSLLYIEQTDTEIIEFVKDITTSYTDMSIINTSRHMCNCYQENNLFALGFDANIPIGLGSNTCMANIGINIYGLDTNTECPLLSKIYYRADSNNEIISGSEFINVFKDNTFITNITSIPLYVLLTCNKNETVNNILDFVVKKYKSIDIDIINMYVEDEVSYDDIDEIID